MSTPSFDISHLDDFTAPACQHHGHINGGANHDNGDAAALLTLTCPACGDVNGPLYACHAFAFTPYLMRCGRCKFVTSAMQFRKVLGRL